MKSFEGKVVIVTGAAGGIGRASALAFAEEGACVVVADIDLGRVQEVAAVMGDKALAVKVDVADEASCQSMVDQAVEKFGRLDVIFNNAGIAGVRARTADQKSEDWRRVIDINLSGVFYCSKAAIPEMQKAGGGVIVNTASVDGLVGMASIPHYSAAKHGVNGLTKACALEYAKDNIRCVSVCPGFIDTAMTQDTFKEGEAEVFAAAVPMGRAAKPEEVSNMVLWLASDKASYVSGSAHQVDAGLLAGFSMPS